jgi:hypothetical protein
VRVKKPSAGNLLLGLISFIAIGLSVSLSDGIEPIHF